MNGEEGRKTPAPPPSPSPSREAGPRPLSRALGLLGRSGSPGPACVRLCARVSGTPAALTCGLRHLKDPCPRSLRLFIFFLRNPFILGNNSLQFVHYIGKLLKIGHGNYLEGLFNLDVCLP